MALPGPSIRCRADHQHRPPSEAAAMHPMTPGTRGPCPRDMLLHELREQRPVGVTRAVWKPHLLERPVGAGRRALWPCEMQAHRLHTLITRDKAVAEFPVVIEIAA